MFLIKTIIPVAGKDYFLEKMLKDHSNQFQQEGIQTSAEIRLEIKKNCFQVLGVP